LFTQGEWKVAEETGVIVCNGWMIANTAYPGEADEQMTKANILERDANARLIAAAPKMYKALKDCVEYFRNEILRQYREKGTIPYFEEYNKGVLALAEIERKEINNGI